jgi:hypothetical protein
VIRIGPQSLSASYESASFILGKIGFLQQLVKRSGSVIPYQSVWTVNFNLPDDNPLLNSTKIDGEDWSVDFGNGTRMDATVVEALPYYVVLEEVMFVTDKNITMGEEELLEQEFLCYKVFDMELTKSVQGFSLLDSGVCYDDWSWSWRIHVWDGEFTLSFDFLRLDVYANLDLLGFVGWKHKWFRLKWAKAWMELQATLNVNATLEFEQDYQPQKAWSKTLFDWNSTYHTFVGPIPVRLKLQFKPIVTLAINVQVKTNITWGVKATGRLRAGAGWKRDGGWDLIFDAAMDVNRTDPDWEDASWSVTVTIKPSLAFRLVLLFYDLLGPFVEIEPYITLVAMYDGTWHFVMAMAGVNLNAGIEFVDVLKKILRISDYERTLYDMVLWQSPEPSDHDVMITSVTPDPDKPKIVFIGEAIPISVDVLNKGSTNPEDVYVTLNWTGGSQRSPATGYIQQKTGNFTTYNFNCTTDGMSPDWYDITVEAWYNGAIQANDTRTLTVFLDNQDINITNMTINLLGPPYSIARGTELEINVTVLSEAYILDISAVEIFVFYNGTYIGELWCEYMHIIIIILPGSQRDSTFTWRIPLDFPPGKIYLSANATALEYETDTVDNQYNMSDPIYVVL